MKTGLKCALYFFLGCGVGVAGTWFALDKHYRDKLNSEMEDMQAYIDKTYRPKKKTQPNVTERSKKVTEETYKSHVNAEKELIESYKETINPNATKYNTTTIETPTEKVNPRPTEEIVEDHPEEDEDREPYIITRDEYVDIEPYYDKVSLIYDKKDSSLTDYNTDELVSAADTIGGEVLEKLDDIKDFTYVYVRNDMISTDYEIEVRTFEDLTDE